ncbi:hypothetical protein DMH26_28605 [Streptomyces sp. WAC 05379]|uniref:hypothetical protein n=1 Tax=Streptomyces sp. WAC 05379 TaxID=2203207 RepID=UPI000F7380BF|nr:hypothetical protein [Streptomyces sp. WAC 05379]RSN90120.1 hypothetical protein DMH26_28605 [Streptomyces sp. WAC 05379]
MNPNSPAGPGSTEPPFLSLHTAVVLIAALIGGLIVGGLTMLAGAPLAGAVLAGLSAFGSSVPILRSLISPLREEPPG